MTTPNYGPERLEEISNQVADLQENVNGINGHLGALENQVGDLHKQVGGLQENVNGVGSRLGALENQVAGLQEDVSGVNGRLGALESQVGDLHRQVGDMGNRVSGVESKVDAMNQTLLAATATLKSLDDKVNLQMESLNQSVADLRARMLSIEQRISTFYITTVGAFLVGLIAVVVNNILTRGS